ncbi:MAG: hypothetical protein JSR59_05770 [Proteobacteria bacterium]|nr:hypothetical protein [Pseudomonadota bacterium]
MTKSLLAGSFALAITITGAAWAAYPQNNAQAPAAQADKTMPAAHPMAAAHREAMRTEPVGQVWDWSKIDTNHDQLIEPAEMEAWLKANPPVQKGG